MSSKITKTGQSAWHIGNHCFWVLLMYNNIPLNLILQVIYRIYHEYMSDNQPDGIENATQMQDICKVKVDNIQM
jgi:hypothetical protein